MPPDPNVLSSIDMGLSVPVRDVTVYFARDGEKFDFFDTQGDWSRYAKAQAMAALEAYAAVIDLSFAEIGDSGAATFVLTKSPAKGASLGTMNPPDAAYGDTQGYAWFNADPYWGGKASGLLDPGSYTFTIFLHEFGHGLGLAHPFEATGGSTVIPEIDPGGMGLDQGIFTVMSYNDGWPEAPEGSPDSRAWGWNLGPSAIDIAVLQATYGANPDTGAGRSAYTLPKENGSGTGYLTIWDVGGTDTIRHSGSRDAVIDLRAASLQAEAGGGGFVSHASGVHGGFTIAHGVVIENARGGTGDDTITGNAAANRLKGGAGRDTLSAEAGADLLFGGKGRDALSGGRGRDELHGGPGADLLKGGAGRDVLTGGAGADIFVIGKGLGRDRIADFQDGVDVIHVKSGAARFPELKIVQAGDDTLVKLGGTTVRLDGLSSDLLDPGDFTF